MCSYELRRSVGSSGDLWRCPSYLSTCGELYKWPGSAQEPCSNFESDFATKSIKWHVGGGPKLQFQRTTSTASRPGKKLPRSRGVINFNSPSRFMFVERINAYHSLTRSILVEISRESTRPSVSRDCSHPSLLISTGYFTLGPPRFAYPLATDFTHAA
jgi:hypothetical protein